MCAHNAQVCSYKSREFYRTIKLHDDGISRSHDENIIVRKCNG